MNAAKRGRPALEVPANETLEQRLKKRKRWLNYYYKLTPQQQWIRAALNNSKKRARHLGVHHNLTSADIARLIPEDLLCPILGIPLDIQARKGGMTPQSATIDRIDPKGDYTPQNCHVICNLANRGKAHMDLLQLTKLGLWAATKLSEQD